MLVRLIPRKSLENLPTRLRLEKRIRTVLHPSAAFALKIILTKISLKSLKLAPMSARLARNASSIG
jgi:hypothetical protein